MPKKTNLTNLNSKPHEYYNQKRPEMLKFIPQNAKTILDVGCGKGSFAKQLKTDSNKKVWGIEIEKQAGKIAQSKLDKVYIGNAAQIIKTLPNNFFDCIVFNDVLEHFVDPYKILTETKEKLAKKGTVVCSIPNVRYIATLKELLIKKDWQYRNEGILDKTHLRFFTKKSIVKMFNNLGYKVEIIKGINPHKSIKFTILNTVFLGQLSDTKYLQYACVAKPNYNV